MLKNIFKYFSNVLHTKDNTKILTARSIYKNVSNYLSVVLEDEKRFNAY
jgi:hypothetical protein